MKNQLAKLLTVALMVTGATNFVLGKAFTDQTRPVSGFTSIASSGSFHVYVKIDGTESLKINADDAVINEIETVVESGTLKIRYKGDHGFNWRDNNHANAKVDIYVSAKSLSSLINSGSGSIKVENTINTSNFKAVLSGSGSITTDVKAGEVQATISGSGNIHLSGNANDASISISGSGNVEAKELKTQSSSVSISGSGNVHIDAEKELSSRIVGSGSVRYSGNAAVNTTKVGSGSVYKAD
jgi:hypothetical protein